MKLEITDPSGILGKSFIEWLAIQIRNKVIKEININKLIRWDEYFNSETVYKSIYKKKISTKDIITAGICNLYYQTSETGFWIKINPNIFTPGLDRIKLDTICRLINYGNQQISGYPIFTTVFEDIAQHINEYVERYMLIS